MTANGQIKVGPCRPVDTTGLPLFPDAPMPEVMVDDTLMACPRCTRDMWVSPAKRFLGSTGHIQLMCYHCAKGLMALAEDAGDDVAIMRLQPFREEHPRLAGGPR